MLRLSTILISLTFVLSACKKDESDTSGSASASAKASGTASASAKPAPTPAPASGSAVASGTASAAPAAKVTDPQIAQIVVTANQIDIDAANAAKAKTKNPDVSKFADTMITDHTKINDAATALVKKLGVTPEASDISKGLETQAAATKTKMDALTGADFDKAYVANEVAYHQQVLDALDQLLIPSAQNADLKAALQGARPIVAEHLDHAKMIQSGMK